MKLDRFHQVALKLDALARLDGFDEAFARSAINRYYYGAAWAIDAAAPALGLAHRPGKWKHGSLAPALAEGGHDELAQAIAELYAARAAADYDPDAKIDAKHLTDARAAAELIRAYINALPPKRPRR